MLYLTNQVYRINITKMEDYNYQKKLLQRIYSEASLAPVFKENPKYCFNQFADMMPYIAYKDILGNKYIIRGRPSGIFNPYDSEERAIIAEYKSLDELVNDGWRLN